MKKINLFKLLFSALFVFAATAFTSCVDDNADDGIPYITVEPTSLSFDAQGNAEGVSYFVVKSNRAWVLDIDQTQYEWVHPSAWDGKAGSTKVEIVIPAHSDGRTATAEFQLVNNYGVYESVEVTILQGGGTAEPLFNEPFTGTAITASYPFIPDGTDASGNSVNIYLVKGGTGWVSTTEYLANKASVRGTAGAAASALTAGFSGGNHMWLAAPTAGAPSFLTANNLAIEAGTTGVDFSFGAIYASSDPVTTTTGVFTVEMSTDGGTTWSTAPHSLSAELGGTKWKRVTGSYDLPAGATTLSFKINYASESGTNTDGIRVEDMTIYPRSGASTLPSVSADPATVSFGEAADNTGKTVALTVANQGSYTLFVKSSDETNFPATLSGTTVTIKATANPSAGQRTATVTAYLATSKDATAVASTGIGVSQDASATGEPDKISAVIAGGAEKSAVIQGTVVALSTQSMVVTDDTGSIYVFYGSSGPGTRSIGEVVRIAGTTQAYGNIIQLSSVTSTESKSTGSYTYPTPVEMTGAQIDAYTASSAPMAIQYVEYTGTLTISGTYYNVAVTGATKQASINYPTAAVLGTAVSGQVVTVKGYTVGTPNTNTNYMNTCATWIGTEAGTPVITSITPTFIQWPSSDVSAQTFAVVGSSLTDVTASATTTNNFNVVVSNKSATGATVTVTPKAANAGATSISEVLTIAATGGNSLTAAIKHRYVSTSTDLFYESFGTTQAASPWQDVGSVGAEAFLIEDGTAFSTSSLIQGGGSSVRWAASASGTAATAGLSGVNHMWMGKPSAADNYFIVKNLSLTDETAVDFSFGILVGTSTAITTANADMTVAMSVDGGDTWTDVPHTYSAALTSTNWKMASGTYTIPGGSTKLSMRILYAVNAANADGLRIDDIKIAKSTGSTPGTPNISTVTAATSVTWAATETDARTINVVGTDLTEVTAPATANFNTSVTLNSVTSATITVTPKATNTTGTDFSDVLTVTATGGNSKDITLTQSKPVVSTPNISSVTAATSVTWAHNETDARTINVVGTNLAGVTAPSTTNFTVTPVSQNATSAVFSVTPKATNTTGTDFSDVLTVSATGGNNKDITLTQSKEVPAGGQTITLSFADGGNGATAGFNTTASATVQNLTIEGLAWKGFQVYKNSSNKFLMFPQNVGSYLETPAIAGKTLKSITVTTGAQASVSATAVVTTADGVGTVVSAQQTLNAVSTDFTFTLTGAAANTSYRFTGGAKNMQAATLVFVYE